MSMNSSERVKAVFGRQLPDRVPYCELHIDQVFAANLDFWEPSERQTLLQKESARRGRGEGRLATIGLGPAEDALRLGKRVVTGSYSLAAQLESVDIVADVTPYPSTGAETAFACIQHGKDIILVNIEADVTVGHILHHLAQQAGVLYSVSSGDEPGCLMELWDFVTALGYEPIVIGKGENNPLNPQATPDTVAESAREADKDPFTVASYVDGTKTMFEMTCAANATGCRPVQRGMIACGPFLFGR